MINYKDYDYIIGIDPGVNTGFALWNRNEKRLLEVKTLMAIQAEKFIIDFLLLKSLLVRFEDARLRTWFGKAGKEQLQGAGSIKRDCSRWEEFLTYYDIPFEEVAPKNNRTKISAEEFKRLTGWNERCSEHARDAAMLCFGL